MYFTKNRGGKRLPYKNCYVNQYNTGSQQNPPKKIRWFYFPATSPINSAIRIVGASLTRWPSW